MNSSYTYIFIRKDLSIPQQIVQASHAALEVGATFTPATSPSIVLFGVSDELELKKAADYLSKHKIEHKMFYEPDFNTGYTAIATKPITGEQRFPLRRYSLLKGK